MLLLPALSMKTAVRKRSFAPIVKEKATKKCNVGRNPTMLSNAKSQAQYSCSTDCHSERVRFGSLSGERQKPCSPARTCVGSCTARSTGSCGYHKWSQSYSKKYCRLSSLRPLFPTRAATQAGGIPLKTYSVFNEWLQITDSFSAHFDAWDLLTSANIEVPFILGLSWLLHPNSIPNFDPITIQWQDSSFTVTDSIEEPLDLESLIQIPADFQVMYVQLETFDESLEEPTFPKKYRDLANIFLSFNANSLPTHQDEDHAIELEPGKTLPFGPLYNLSEYQLKTLRK